MIFEKQLMQLTEFILSIQLQINWLKVFFMRIVEDKQVARIMFGRRKFLICSLSKILFVFIPDRRLGKREFQKLNGESSWSITTFILLKTACTERLSILLIKRTGKHFI